MPTMPKLETPEDEEILQFLNNLADYCIPMDGGKMRMTSQVWPIVRARDAAIRAESTALLKTCREALEGAMGWNKTAQETLNPDRDIPCDDQAWVQIERANKRIDIALAALKEEGVLEC